MRPAPRTFPVSVQVLGALLLLAGVVFAARSKLRSLATSTPATMASPTGAGVQPDDLSVQMHQVVITDELLALRDWTVTRRWVFRGSTHAQAADLLRDVPGAADALRCDDSGCAYWPTYEAVAALGAGPRSRLYNALARMPGNPQSDDTFHRAVELGPFSAGVDMPAEARPLVDALTWTEGGVPSFSDLGVVCGRLGSAARCRDFVRSLLSRRSASVTLRLTDAAAVERIASAFLPEQRAAVRARLNAERVAGESSLALAALLPPWAQQRLDTFPAVGEDWTNCYWSALRFVDDATGPIESGPAMDAVLARDFERIPTATQFGDVVVLRDQAGVNIHSATRLLGGYVFTKNGHGRFQAWRIVPMTDLTTDFWNVASVESWRRRG